MAQTTKISAINKSKGSDNVMTSEFIYDDLEQNVIECFLADADGILNGVLFDQGSLVFFVKDYGTKFYLNINSEGDLILSADDAENYSINASGNLIYTKNDMTTVNLGFVKPIHAGTSAPSNTQMIWYDTNPSQLIHKYYKTATASWVQLGT